MRRLKAEQCTTYHQIDRAEWRKGVLWTVYQKALEDLQGQDPRPWDTDGIRVTISVEKVVE